MNPKSWVHFVLPDAYDTGQKRRTSKHPCKFLSEQIPTANTCISHAASKTAEVFLRPGRGCLPLHVGVEQPDELREPC